jgi:AraC-like DNA-binding protein
MSAQPEYEPFAHYVPRAPLSDYIDILWIYEGYSVPHMQERLMPTGSMELVIGLDEDGRMGAGLAGAQSSYVVLDTSTPFSLIGAHFKPGGSFPFFRMPAGEFQDLQVSLEAVWGPDANDVQEQLQRAKTRDARFRILERALLEKSRGRLGKHPAVPYALKVFGEAEIPCSVRDLTEEIGLSARRFIEVFRNEVGLSPKLYSRIQRFRKVLNTFHRIPDPDFTDVALSFGYFDQAHFIHEFRAFSGMSPSTYLRHRSLHINHVPILD